MPHVELPQAEFKVSFFCSVLRDLLLSQQSHVGPTFVGGALGGLQHWKDLARLAVRGRELPRPSIGYSRCVLPHQATHIGVHDVQATVVGHGGTRAIPALGRDVLQTSRRRHCVRGLVRGRSRATLAAARVAGRSVAQHTQSTYRHCRGWVQMRLGRNGGSGRRGQRGGASSGGNVLPDVGEE